MKKNMVKHLLLLPALAMAAGCSDAKQPSGKQADPNITSTQSALTSSGTQTALVVVDTNTNHNSPEEAQKIVQYAEQMGLAATVAEEPVGGLSCDRLVGVDVVIYAMRGWPWRSSATRNSLLAFAQQGGSVFLIGDDVSWGVPNLEPLVGLKNPNSPNYDLPATEWIQAQFNGSVDRGLEVLPANSQHPIMANLASPAAPFVYAQDLDTTAVLGAGEDVLLTARGGQPMMVARTLAGGGKVVTMVPNVYASETPSSDAAGLQQLKNLFQSSLAWLSASGSRLIECRAGTTLVNTESGYALAAPGQAPVALTQSGTQVGGSTFSGWTALGAQTTSDGGFEVVWGKTSGEFSRWLVDSQGNHISSGLVPESTIIGLEPRFDQDFNGDGCIGMCVLGTIESFGNSSLVNTSLGYQLQGVGGQTLPISYQGSQVGPASLAGWRAIGANINSSGQGEVVWKADNGTYSHWLLDANGNFSTGGPTSEANIIGMETRFEQDLNGDGCIGACNMSVVEAFGSTRLLSSNMGFFLQSVAGGAQVPLSINGSQVEISTIPGWQPIGANPDRVAWKGPGNQYSLWSIDAQGAHLTSNEVPESTIIQQEPFFEQDLNLDGCIGPCLLGTVESYGNTSLIETSIGYQIQTGGGAPVTLLYQGALASPSSLPGWIAIGANTNSAGQAEVVWRNVNGTFSHWIVDGGGNYVSGGITNATNIILLESSFAQDLNGDGMIGCSTVIQNGACVAQCSPDRVAQAGICECKAYSVPLGTECAFATATTISRSVGSPVAYEPFTITAQPGWPGGGFLGAFGKVVFSGLPGYEGVEVPLNGSGQATLSVNLLVGSYAVTATYVPPGSNHPTIGQPILGSSASMGFSIGKANTSLSGQCKPIIHLIGPNTYEPVMTFSVFVLFPAFSGSAYDPNMTFASQFECWHDGVPTSCDLVTIPLNETHTDSYRYRGNANVNPSNIVSCQFTTAP